MFKKFQTILADNLKDKHFSEVLTGSVLSFGVKILTVVLGLITNLIIAKYYGAEVVGTLALLMSIVAIATMISLMGMDVSVLRFIPPLFTRKEFTNIYEIIKKSFLFIMMLALVISVCIYLYSHFIATVIFDKPQLESLIVLISFFIIFQVLGKFSIASIRALKNIKVFLILQFLPAVFNLVILLSITFIFYNINNPVYSQIASQVIIALLSILFLKKYLSTFKKDTFTNSTSLEEILRTSFPMFLTAVMQMVVLQTDVLMLSSMSTLENVGIYSIVMKLALLSTFIITSINTIIAPKFSELFYNDQINELESVSRKGSKLIFYATLPITLVLVLFGKELLSIFGNEFIVGSFALILLAFGQLVNAMAGSVGYFLNMTGHQKILNKIVLSAGLSNVVLNILLIPMYGIEGAAFASMISMAMWNIAASIYVKKQFGFYIGYIPVITRR